MIESTSFGNDRFLDLVGRCPDIDAHHGSLVGDYRSASFDVVGAVAENTRNVRAVMERMEVGGRRAFVLTGTVFEPGEGTDPRRAFSSYGLSKGITSDIFRWHALEFGVPLAKFVIPNPFGPLEEERFCRYAYCRWLVANRQSCVFQSMCVTTSTSTSSLWRMCGTFRRHITEPPSRYLVGAGM